MPGAAAMVQDMTNGKGRPALVTGATDGVGRVVAAALGKDGWRVLVHGRDRKRGEALVQEIVQAGGSATFLQADLASLAGDAEPIDYLIAHGVYSWVPAPVRDASDYFQDELVRILAGGDAAALGRQ